MKNHIYHDKITHTETVEMKKQKSHYIHQVSLRIGSFFLDPLNFFIHPINFKRIILLFFFWNIHFKIDEIRFRKRFRILFRIHEIQKTFS